MAKLEDYEPIAEAAERWGIKPDSAKKLCQRGRVNAIKVANRWFVKRGEMPRQSAFGPQNRPYQQAQKQL